MMPAALYTLCAACLTADALSALRYTTLIAPPSPACLALCLCAGVCCCMHPYAAARGVCVGC